MTEVIGIKFEENGAVEYVVPDKNYTKGDFVVVLEKKDKRLAPGCYGKYCFSRG